MLLLHGDESVPVVRGTSLKAQGASGLTTTDVILSTALSTLVAAVVAYWVSRTTRRIKAFLVDGLSAVKALRSSTIEATMVLKLIRSELAYMRQMTEQVQAGSAPQEATPPPVGRIGKMPPAFPTRDWDLYPNVPPAKPEDTDKSLLDQTEEDIMAAQEREEKREHGIEPDLDEAPQAAVFEQAE
jgi:hypothetical protein